MSMPTAEQVFRFVKEFGLAICILMVGLWYVSSQQAETTAFVRGKLMEMNDDSHELLSKTTDAINRNTIAFERQNTISDMIQNSVVRQEVTLDSIDSTLETACKTNEATQAYLEQFTKQVTSEHKIQNEKLDQTYKAVTEQQ